VADIPDNLDPPQPVEPSGTSEQRVGFFGSTVGKVVLALAALVVVLIVIGLFAWFFLLNSSAPQSGPSSATTSSGGSTVTSGSAAASESIPPVEPQERPLESTFTFRNVFAPTLKQPTPAAEVASATSSSSTSESAESVPENTLYLKSIQTENGKKTATFIWNGQTYKLGEGDTIPDTPWKVVEIGDSSVVMLYGDTQVTLSPGQGLSK